MRIAWFTYQLNQYYIMQQYFKLAINNNISRTNGRGGCSLFLIQFVIANILTAVKALASGEFMHLLVTKVAWVRFPLRSFWLFLGCRRALFFIVFAAVERRRDLFLTLVWRRKAGQVNCVCAQLTSPHSRHPLATTPSGSPSRLCTPRTRWLVFASMLPAPLYCRIARAISI
jgi:hypothetical protein